MYDTFIVYFNIFQILSVTQVQTHLLLKAKDTTPSLPELSLTPQLLLHLLLAPQFPLDLYLTPQMTEAMIPQTLCLLGRMTSWMGNILFLKLYMRTDK